MQRQGLETHIHVVNKHSYESRESEKHNVNADQWSFIGVLGGYGLNATVLFHQNFIFANVAQRLVWKYIVRQSNQRQDKGKE